MIRLLSMGGSWCGQASGTARTLGETFGIDVLTRPGEGAATPLVPLSPGPVTIVEALLTSLGVVAVAEIGDRTQLLSFFLACQFRRPLPILAGILIATLVNHGIAALFGEWVGDLLSPSVLRWVLGASFVAMAAWALIPDKLEDDVALSRRRGAFMTTLFGFFIAEMGDKTQIATAALAARFGHLLPVVIGTTCGMMLANIPAVLLGGRAGHRMNTTWTRYAAALIFAIEAVLSFAGYNPL